MLPFSRLVIPTLLYDMFCGQIKCLQFAIRSYPTVSKEFLHFRFAHYFLKILEATPNLCIEIAH